MALPVVHVCWTDLDIYGLDIQHLRSLLSVSENDRASRFRFEHDSRRYIARHGLLRLLLARALRAAPRSLRFTTNAYGKPALVGNDLHFNMSHSHGFALFTWSHGVEVGCDIERQNSRIASESIPEQFFSADECHALRRLPASMQTEGFFNAWTRKEAYIKGHGEGLSLPLDSFDVSLGPDEEPALLRGCDGWSVQCLEPEPFYPAAIVAAAPSWRMEIHPLHPAALLADTLHDVAA